MLFSLEIAVFLRYLLILACQLLFLLGYSLLYPATGGKSKAQTPIWLRPDDLTLFMEQEGSESLMVECLTHQKTLIVCVSSPGGWVRRQRKRRTHCSRLINLHMFFEAPNQHLCCRDVTPEDTCACVDSGITDGSEAR